MTFERKEKMEAGKGRKRREYDIPPDLVKNCGYPLQVYITLSAKTGKTEKPVNGEFN